MGLIVVYGYVNSTKRFTDWPTNRSFWTLGGNGNGMALITVAEEQGYIRPVQ